LSAWYNFTVAMEMVVKEIVDLFHKRDKGINNYDETYELWLSQPDYLPNFIPAFKEPFKIESEVIAVEPDLTSPKYKGDPIGAPRRDYIRVVFVKEVFSKSPSPGIELLERFMTYFLVKTVLGWKIYRASSSGDRFTWFPEE
jgi:hypothetical protein